MTSTARDPTILASKRALYVGGLDEDVTPTVLRAAFIPFGNVRSCDMPMDYKIGKHRHFAFVEFDDAEDAAEAIFNMDGSDLMGKTMRVSLAQQNQLAKLSSSSTSSSADGGAGAGEGTAAATTATRTNRHQAVWSSDEWFQQQVTGGGPADEQKRNEEQQDVQTLMD